LYPYGLVPFSPFLPSSSNLKARVFLELYPTRLIYTLTLTHSSHQFRTHLRRVFIKSFAVLLAAVYASGDEMASTKVMPAPTLDIGANTSTSSNGTNVPVNDTIKSTTDICPTSTDNARASESASAGVAATTSSS
jgi:hypothetical protein